jgi:hypothetical protein
MERMLDARYRAWRQWVDDHAAEIGPSSRSEDRLFDNDPFGQLVALGPSSVPLMMTRIHTDAVFLAAIARITGVKFHMHRAAPTPGHCVWTVDELPGFEQADHAPNFSDVWLRWWNDERFHAPERFEKLHAERQALLQQGDAKGAQEKYERIQNLGIAVLPCLRDKIGQGATDLVPIMSALTNGAVKPDASPADCAKWWNAHKQEWTLPAATATDKAK